MDVQFDYRVTWNLFYISGLVPVIGALCVPVLLCALPFLADSISRACGSQVGVQRVLWHSLSFHSSLISLYKGTLRSNLFISGVFYFSALCQWILPR